MSNVKNKMSNVNKVKPLSERTSRVPPVIFLTTEFPPQAAQVLASVVSAGALEPGAWICPYFEIYLTKLQIVFVQAAQV